MRHTALDLLPLGYTVHLVVDTCTSMKNSDRNVGIQSMRDAGCRVASVESTVFELVRDAKNPLLK